jgi:hypothetical protein
MRRTGLCHGEQVIEPGEHADIQILETLQDPLQQLLNALGELRERAIRVPRGIERRGPCAPAAKPAELPSRPVERTHSWMNGFAKLRRMTDRDAAIIRFYLYLAATFVTVRALIQRARCRDRWETRPTTKRLK